jgi:F0F1-type ATP synthase membrane subunit c/vacuolar-type H+-ATPase subunit K
VSTPDQAPQNTPPKSASTRPQKSPALQTLRFLVGAVIGALFLMAVALMFVLGVGAPPLLSVALVLLIGAGLYFLIETVGYRVKAVSPHLSGDAARQEGMKQFQSSLMRRLAMAESVAILGILLAFLARTVLIYDLAASVSILLLLMHVWPSERTIDRVVTGLEREGARTGLRQLLGFGGTQDGPVTRVD